MPESIGVEAQEPEYQYTSPTKALSAVNVTGKSSKQATESDDEILGEGTGHVVHRTYVCRQELSSPQLLSRKM